jgi:GTPase SAR1 family protein
MGNNFMDCYDPTWEPDYRKQVSVDGVAALIECLDVSYTEYTALQELWFKDADACMFVYSVSSRSSFECLHSIYQHWVEVKGHDCAPMILVGNKCDQENREVSEAEGMDLAKAFDSKFLEMSRFKVLSAEEAFFTLVREVRAYWAERKLLEEIQAAAHERPRRSELRDLRNLHRTS